MTTAIANNVNTLEEMLVQTPTTQPVDATCIGGMDKTADFTKIFESKIEEPTTIGDLKSQFSNLDLSDKMANFKEILAQATDEANVETSLDLTLARDINEIINQLKEAVKDAEEKIEEDNSFETIATENYENIVDENIDLNTNTELLEEDSKPETKEQNIEEIILPFNNKIELIPQKLEVELDYETTDKINLKALNDLLNAKESNNTDLQIDIPEEIMPKETIKSITENTNTEESIILDDEILKELNIESLESQSDTKDGESNLQYQAPEEYGVKAIINKEIEPFEFNIDKINSPQNFQSTPQQVTTKTVDVNPSKIIDQVVKQMEGMQNGSKVNIVLNPESLGKVNIQLMSTKEGLTAQLTVATQEAKDILMKGLDGLKENLITQGIGVDNVSVKVADTQKGSYNPDWTEQEGSRGGNKNQQQNNREEKEKGLFEKMMAQTKKEENGNV